MKFWVHSEGNKSLSQLWLPVGALRKICHRTLGVERATLAQTRWSFGFRCYIRQRYKGKDNVRLETRWQ